MIANIEELEKMDASEIDPRRINAKEVSTPQGRRIHIPSCRWYSIIARKRLRTPRTHSKAATKREE